MAKNPVDRASQRFRPRRRVRDGARAGFGVNGRAAVLHPVAKGEGPRGRAPEARLREARGLAEAIDLEVVHAEVCHIKRPRSSSLFGAGRLALLSSLIEQRGVGLAVVDAALTPVQQRNLELAWNCKVIDRTGLILEIFGARARTREGLLQVELAALSYQRSRLVRSWTHLERQRGGYGFFGGPGETQIEADRRQIDQRINKIRSELEDVRRTRALHRRARQRVPCPVIALVGYTNAGKSTLFNHLTRAEILATDLLFTTLDPTMRAIELPSGRKAILSDTVGFISELPTHLVAAFQATLEEVVAADLVVHVRDISHPDCEAQKLDVHHVLCQLGLEATVDAGLVEALNKIDLLDAEARRRVQNRAARDSSAVPVSALTGEGCADLVALLDRCLSRSRRVVEYSLSLEDGSPIAWLYDHGEVISRRDDGGFVHLRVGLDQDDIARFERRISPRSP